MKRVMALVFGLLVAVACLTACGGKNVDDECGHNYDLTSEREATCESEGEKIYTCRMCGDVYTESVPKLKIYLSDRLLSKTAYHEEIKKLHPEAASYKLALEENEDKVYTNTGSASNYSGVCMIHSDGYMFSKKSGESQYLVNYSSGSKFLLVQVSAGMGTLQEAIADATAILKDYPAGLTAEELYAKFQEEGQTNTYQGTVSSTTVTEYKDTIHGVEYSITKYAKGSVVVRLGFSMGYGYTDGE